jgi:hypothetical protein
MSPSLGSLYPQTPGIQKFRDCDEWMNRIGNLTLPKRPLEIKNQER